MNRKILITVFIFFITGQLFSQTASTDNEIWSLKSAIEYARANNITVKKAELAQKSAEVSYEQSKFERFPNLTGGVSQSFTNGSSIDPITSEYLSSQIFSNSLSLNSSVTLYAGGQITNQVEQNKLLVGLNALSISQAQNDVTLSIIEAYLKALYLDEGMKINSKNLEASARLLEQTDAQYELGAISAKDVADARSQLASDQYNMLSAMNNYAQQLQTIKSLLELDPSAIFVIDTTLVPDVENLITPQLEDVYQLALLHLPEIKALYVQQDISNLDMTIAKAGYKPTLSLNGRLYTGYTNTQQNTFFKQIGGNFNQQVGLSLSIPIFDRKQTSSRVQQAQISMEESQLDQLSTLRNLYRQIESTWLNANSARGERQSALTALEASETAYNLANQQYELGVISIADLLISQNNYLNASRYYLQTKYSELLYNLLLKFYMGEEISF